jgi:uncharacterized protein YkwD
MAKKESKKKSQIMLWVGISFISVAVITFLIFGFSTQWTFKPNSNKSNKPNKQSNKKAGNIEIGESLQYEDTPQSTSDDPIIDEKVIIEDDGTLVVSKPDGTMIKTDTYTSQQEDVKDEYAKKMTEWHNEIRGKCNKFGKTGDLKWNNDLAKQATAYAVKLVNLNPRKLDHYLHDNQRRSSYGAKIPSSENLASFSPGDIQKNKDGLLQSGKIAITGTSRVGGYNGGWAGEGFDVNNEHFVDTSFIPLPTCTTGENNQAGHYTALNWSESRNLGCGTAITSKGSPYTVTVCHYANKKGNVWQTMDGRTGKITTKTVDDRKKVVKCTEPLSLDDRDGELFECQQ